MTGAGSVVALTLLGPTALQVEDVVAGADLLQELELSSDEVTSGIGSGGGVEEGVDVGTGNIDSTANGGGDSGVLPDVESLGDGVRAGVATALALDDGDELSELSSRAEAVHNGLVTDDEELDNIPLGPGGNGVDLALDIGGVIAATITLDKDTKDQVNAVLLGSTTNVLKSAAVSGVDTDDLETGVLELGDVGVNLISSLAVASGRLIGSISDTIVVVVAAEATAGSHRLGLRSRGRLGGLGLGSSRCRVGGGRVGGCAGLGGLLSGLSGRRRRSSSRAGGAGGCSSGSRSRGTGAGEGAVGDVVGLGDGDDLLGSSVGTGLVAGRDRVHQESGRGDHGGDGSNGVGTSSRADVGGLHNDAGNHGAAG